MTIGCDKLGLVGVCGSALGAFLLIILCLRFEAFTMLLCVLAGALIGVACIICLVFVVDMPSKDEGSGK